MYNDHSNGVTYLKVITPFNIYDIATSIYDFKKFAEFYELDEDTKNCLNLYLELGDGEIDLKKYKKLKNI